MENESFNIKIIKRAERVFKGGANKNRLKILDYVCRENITSIWAISQELNLAFRNVSQHTIRLEKAGLIEKIHSGRAVFHVLTLYGEKMIKFINDLSAE